jgi:hypothetical protein
MSDRCRAHLGDFVAVSPEDVVIVSKDLNMVGQHGGATPAEMEIPLIVASDLKSPPIAVGTGARDGRDDSRQSARL